MNRFFQKLFSLFILINLSLFSFGQIPNGYYDSAQGLIGEDLRAELHTIIDGHTVISYNGLWNAYIDTDKREDGKVWDIYSNCNFTFVTDQCGNYSNICDCYNREHTVPKSWFNSASPMYSDLFHLLPTDGKVNGYRSNFPYGECTGGTVYGTGKLGNSSFQGYNNKVFEPADEYKGDIARIYFYVATRYMDKINSWNSDAFSGNNLSSWTINLMLKWHRQDPVSQKEIDRNEAVFSYQHNRNPFVDNPEWADMIWDPNYVYSTFSYSKVYFDVFPNPANEFINISYTLNNTSDYIINIYDNTGRIIKTIKPNSNKDIIDINHISAGSYFIKLESKEQSYTRQFIITK